MPPILLLKTKSSPHDGYHDFFSANNYTPSFIPVLEHRFHTENLAQVRSLFASGAFDSNASENHTKYGGMIFTSQRAVEGFANMIAQHGRTSPTFLISPTSSSSAY
jgi:uroporphyrinogen-III synthase